MSHKPRTAILVIHGIGQQSPFETLDSFAQGLLPVAEERFGCRYELFHRQVAREGLSAWESWQQYYVALDSESVPPIDLYEHYWAYRMTGKATLADISEWLKGASRFAREFYDPKKGGIDLRNRADQNKDSPLNRMLEPGSERLHGNCYLRLLGFAVPVMLPLMAFVEDVLPANRFIKWLYRLAAGRFKAIVIDYVGDVAVYTQTDRKAKLFPVRQQMLLDARMAIEALLTDERYDQVIVLGHSLGSVVAYDALNRLHKAPPLLSGADRARACYDRLRGLVTFGSPLDKTFFFFQADVKPDQLLREEILNNLHSFKRRAMPAVRGAKQLPLMDETSNNLQNVEWVNFFDRNDPISGYLDAFQADNVRLDMGVAFGAAHVAYWKHAAMYDEILRRFFSEYLASDTSELPQRNVAGI